MDEIIVRCCAPTLAGMKTGSLFSCPCTNRNQLHRQLKRLNKTLAPQGLCVMVLRYDAERALLYLFSPDSLEADLAEAEATGLLREAGYTCQRPAACIARLIERLNENREFPHEIGLFLGYPPEDVRGFIQNRAENCKLCGLWKVYGDTERAEKLFAAYRACTEQFCRRLRAGATLGQLAAAT